MFKMHAIGFGLAFVLFVVLMLLLPLVNTKASREKQIFITDQNTLVDNLYQANTY